MSDTINVEKVAKLAKLKLNAEEEKYFEEKFNSILEYVGSISEVNIDDSMMEKDETLQKIYHDDIRQKSPVSPNHFSDQVDQKFFKVPKVID